MALGQFDKVVIFKTNTPSTSGAGYSDSYATLLTTRGRMRRLSGSRSFSFGDIQETNTWELTTRYQSSLASNLSTSLKAEIDSVTYTVTAWENIDEKKQYFRITLSEQRD